MPNWKKQKQPDSKKRERAYKLLDEIDKKSSDRYVEIAERGFDKEGAKMVVCQYCRALIKSTSTKCDHCGAPRKG